MSANGATKRDLFRVISERDAEAGALKGLLQELRHELCTLHGLYVTDKPDAFTDALRDGCDANGAAKCVAEVSWTLNEESLIARIDERMGSDPVVREGWAP